MFIGGVISGHLGDKLKKRAILMPPSLFLLIFFLFMMDALGKSPGWYYFVSLGMGISLGGPYNVMAGPIVIDLGK